MKTKVALMCSECLRTNYSTNKSKNERIVVKKYCPNCNKHTEHKEVK